MKNVKKGKRLFCFLKNKILEFYLMNRYRRLEEMMNAEGLSDQEVEEIFFLKNLMKIYLF